MSKRVYELAKELGLRSRDVIAALAAMGVVAKSHSSTVDDSVAERLKKAAKEGTVKPASAEKPARRSARPQRSRTERPSAERAPVRTIGAMPAPKRAVRPRTAPPRTAPPRTASPRTASPRTASPETRAPSQAAGPPAAAEAGAGTRPPAGRPAATGAERTRSPAAAAQTTTATQTTKAPPEADRAAPADRAGSAAAAAAATKAAQPTVAPEAPRQRIPLAVRRGVTVQDFAEKLGVPAAELVKKLFLMGEMVTVTQSLDDEAASLIGEEYGREVTVVSPDEEEEPEAPEEDAPEDLTDRPPVITVMGHVDHGKTLLLDRIRETKVVEREAGGITQHIGAYQVSRNGRRITFIDTPGHEAFTQMRARGAKVTDIAVLVVAADDGVMPQTLEAISHARAARVPIVVAINKIDKPEADAQRVRQQLTEHGLIPEEWGGDTIVVEVSAKAGDNLDQLLEMLLLVADLQELKANPTAPARGVVVEAHLDRGRGPVATVLIQRGTLRAGDAIACGGAWCKVRAMLDETGQQVKEAPPGTPVQVLGFSLVPQAGDDARAVGDERAARQLAQGRLARQRAADLVSRSRVTLEDFLKQAGAEGGPAELRMVLKADMQGSLEAVDDSLQKLDVGEGIKVRPLHKGVGAITENDIALAQASDAIVLGFNVRPDAKARALAERERVEVRTYQIIYKLVEDIEAALKGLLKPQFREQVTGRADVREVFRGSRIGVVAGCYVEEGTITRGSRARLLRSGVIVTDTTVSSLRRFKDDVREVAAGYECGIGLDAYSDIKVGDAVELYEVREIPRG